MNKSFFTTLLTIILLAATNYHAKEYSLLTTFIGSGDLAGGVRCNLNKNWAIDGWYSANNDDGKSNSSFWADIFYKRWGIIITKAENSKDLASAFAYSLEHKLNENIGIGSAVKLVEFEGQNSRLAGSWDVYIILKI